MKKETAIGIDIGGTNSVIGFVTENGTCLTEGSVPTSAFQEVNDFVHALHEKIEALKKDLEEDITVRGIGIGAPNGNFYRGTVEHAPNLNWKGEIHFAELFKKYYDLPVFLTNDANAAAMGEMMYGGAKDMRDFVEITLGTGLGSGLVVNGQMVYGSDGFAGEIGHVKVCDAGRECGCGGRGCLETYVSATGICRTVFELLAEYKCPSSLRNIAFDALDSKMIFEAAEEGDFIAREAFKRTGAILGRSLANTVHHTRPEAIFLFGGLANAGAYIFDPTLEHMNKNLLSTFSGKVKLLMSELDGAQAAVLGSSALVWKESEA